MIRLSFFRIVFNYDILQVSTKVHFEHNKELYNEEKHKANMNFIHILVKNLKLAIQIQNIEQKDDF